MRPANDDENACFLMRKTSKFWRASKILSRAAFRVSPGPFAPRGNSAAWGQATIGGAQWQAEAFSNDARIPQALFCECKVTAR